MLHTRFTADDMDAFAADTHTHAHTRNAYTGTYTIHIHTINTRAWEPEVAPAVMLHGLHGCFPIMQCREIMLIRTNSVSVTL